MKVIEAKAFQSPCGELVGCDPVLHRVLGDRPRFQSPCGELVGCDRGQFFLLRGCTMFQSPCGELVGCDFYNRVNRDAANGFNPLAGN